MGAKKLFSPFWILVLRWKLDRAKLIHEPIYRLVLASCAQALGLLKLLLGASCAQVLGQFVAPRVDAIPKQLLCRIALLSGLC